MGFFEQLGDNLLSIGGPLTDISIGKWIIMGIVAMVLVIVLILMSGG